MSDQENTIQVNKCRNCGLLQDLSHIRCIKCKQDQFEIVEASQMCELLSFTILKAPPSEFLSKKSYALGIVQFDNGVKALGQITTSENLSIGMKLTPVYQKLSDNYDGKELYNYVFKPINT